MGELERQLARSRARPGFMDRLARRVKEDKPILDRLIDQPCPSIGTAILGVDAPVSVRCSGLEGHKGLHSFYIEWTD